MLRCGTTEDENVDAPLGSGGARADPYKPAPALPGSAQKDSLRPANNLRHRSKSFRLNGQAAA